MLSLPPAARIFLAAGTTDMRKGMSSLASAARTVLDKDPFAMHVFAFCGRRRNLVKLLLWDGLGFWLVTRRLARGTFDWPSLEPGKTCVELRSEELLALLGGLELRRSRWRKWTPQSRRAA